MYTGEVYIDVMKRHGLGPHTCVNYAYADGLDAGWEYIMIDSGKRIGVFILL